jgi:Tfp pilus assembly protein PilF
MWHLNQRNKEDTNRAAELFEETIARDSSMARAYSGCSRTLLNTIGFGWSRKPEEHLRKAKELALEAVRKDDSDPFNHDALGRVFTFYNDLENAIREHRIAMKLNPNSAYTHWGLGEALQISGRNEEALTHIEEAIKA